MGGAMATICAADVFERGWKIKRLITFGAPKALDGEAAAAITCPVDRYVNAWDPAPHWLPSLDLTHPGERISINSGGWPRHPPSKYIKAIDRYMEGKER